LVQELRQCADEYKTIYIFQAENMRNSGLKEIRQAWGGSRFFFGKNRVMVHALGKTAADEHKKSLARLARVRTHPPMSSSREYSRRLLTMLYPHAANHRGVRVAVHECIERGSQDVRALSFLPLSL
jgi:hypothetical protein